MNQQFYGWKLLAVLCVMMATTSFISFGGSIMNTSMMMDMHLDRKSLGLAFAAMGLCLGIASPFVGYSVNKWGARANLLAGTLMATLGALALATMVNTLVGIVIVYGLVMGCALALSGTIPAQTVVNYWFKRRLALAMTIVVAGSTVGGFVAVPLLAQVIEASSGNWRMGWFVVAAVCAGAFCCSILFVRNKPAEIGQVQDGVVEEADFQSDAKAVSQPTSSVHKTSKDWTVREAVWHPTFWLLIIGLVSGMSSYGIMIGHGVAHFKDLGHSPTMAAMFLSLMILAGLVGKALFAILGDRVEPRFIWGAGQIFVAIGMALGVNATSNIELYATAFLLGAGASVISLGMATLTSNYFGETAFAPIMGIARLLLTLAPSITIVLAGITFDHFGSYALAFYTAAGICGLGGLVMPFAGPPVLALDKQVT
ncbi:MAG: MFS transporter [Gammaproteobacteria bacterium]